MSVFFGRRNKPDFVGCAGIAPSALDLLKPANGLLLPGHGAPRHVEKADRWLRVDGEVQEERDALAVGQNSRLGRALSELLHRHQWKPDLAQHRAQDRPKKARLFRNDFLSVTTGDRTEGGRQEMFWSWGAPGYIKVSKSSPGSHWRDRSLIVSSQGNPRGGLTQIFASPILDKIFKCLSMAKKKSF